jgi:hypothetical protein
MGPTDGSPMPIVYLEADHHCVRYVPWARLRKDEEDNVIGVLGAAFRLRDDEDYLSATWAEFFPGDHEARICASVRAIRASKINVTARSGFAVGVVAAIKDVCLSDRKQHRIRIIHEAADDNPAHTALRGWPRDNDELLELLAEEAWSATVLNAVILP